MTGDNCSYCNGNGYLVKINMADLFTLESGGIKIQETIQCFECKGTGKAKWKDLPQDLIDRCQKPFSLSD